MGMGGVWKGPAGSSSSCNASRSGHDCDPPTPNHKNGPKHQIHRNSIDPDQTHCSFALSPTSVPSSGGGPSPSPCRPLRVCERPAPPQAMQHKAATPYLFFPFSDGYVVLLCYNGGYVGWWYGCYVTRDEGKEPERPGRTHRRVVVQEWVLLLLRHL